ncbi:MAG: LptA/OstA family protein [Thermodesulfobacteriota bacterium]
MKTWKSRVLPVPVLLALVLFPAWLSSGAFAQTAKTPAAKATAATTALPAAADAQALTKPLPGITAGFDLTGGPVNIAADELVFAHEKRQAEFSGHVSAVQKDTVVDAASILLTFAKEKDGKGENAPESIERIEARGDVKIKTGQFTATCDQAAYDVAPEILTLTGKPAVLSRGGNSVTGAVIVLDQKHQTTKVTGAPQSPVFVRLTPEEKPPAKDAPKPAGKDGKKP